MNHQLREGEVHNGKSRMLSEEQEIDVGHAKITSVYLGTENRNLFKAGSPVFRVLSPQAHHSAISINSRSVLFVGC